MSPQDFKKLWISFGGEVDSFDPNVIKSIKISDSEKEYLKVGLPIDAAPYLRFGSLSGAHLQSAQEEYELEEAYKNYKIIGFNGYGDPICLDENDGSVVYLNHDDEFGYIYMAKSLSDLVQLIVIFRKFVTEIKKMPANDVYLVAESTINQMKVIDEEAIDEGEWVEAIESFCC
jgi:hypothetical protein